MTATDEDVAAVMDTAAQAFAPRRSHDPEQVAMYVPVTIGELCARDIGRVIRFTDRGATYLGQLTKVDHESWPSIRDGGLKPVEYSWVRLAGEHGWSHLGRHSIDLTVEFVQP